MAKNPFSLYGRFARNIHPVVPSLGTFPPVSGKTFFVVQSTTDAQLGPLQRNFPIDEDGVQRVYTDLATAVAAVSSGRGDMVILMPGAYTISTVVASAASNWKLVGAGAPGEVMLSGSAASILTLTGNGVEVCNIGFTIASTKVAITMTAASYCYIHDNLFYSTVGGTASHFIRMLTTACNFNQIVHNQFMSNLDTSGGSITQTSHVTLLGSGNLIEGNVFVAGRSSVANAGAVTDGVIDATATDYGNTVRNNMFTEAGGATFTAGVEFGSAGSGGVMCFGNCFSLATAPNAIVNGANTPGFMNNTASGTV